MQILEKWWMRLLLATMMMLFFVTFPLAVMFLFFLTMVYIILTAIYQDWISTRGLTFRVKKDKL